MKLELLYLDGCPTWHQTLENLRQALQAEGMALKVSLTRVVGLHHFCDLRFQGCPSIRLDGKDLFPEHRAVSGLACRLYRTPEGLRGWPTAQMIFQRLKALGVFKTPVP